jgi:hypothetical protein
MKHAIPFQEAKRLLEAADCVVLRDTTGCPWVITKFEYVPASQSFKARSSADERFLTLNGKDEKEVISIEGNEISRTGSSVKLFLYENKAHVPKKAET